MTFIILHPQLLLLIPLLYLMMFPLLYFLMITLLHHLMITLHSLMVHLHQPLPLLLLLMTLHPPLLGLFLPSLRPTQENQLGLRFP